MCELRKWLLGGFLDLSPMAIFVKPPKIQPMAREIIWAIVPVKHLDQSKSRLSPVLSMNRRAAVTLRLLNRQLQVLDQCQAISKVMVVSRDTHVQTLVSSWDCDIFQESEPTDLNIALQESYQSVGDSATHCLILPSDLPLFSAEALNQLLASLPTAAICPDKSESGTNALLLPTNTNFCFRFGINSFAKHQASFRQIGVPFQSLYLPDIAFDLDTPSDWHTWTSIQSSIAKPHPSIA